MLVAPYSQGTSRAFAPHLGLAVPTTDAAQGERRQGAAVSGRFSTTPAVTTPHPPAPTAAGGGDLLRAHPRTTRNGTRRGRSPPQAPGPPGPAGSRSPPPPPPRRTGKNEGGEEGNTVWFQLGQQQERGGGDRGRRCGGRGWPPHPGDAERVVLLRQRQPGLGGLDGAKGWGASGRRGRRVVRARRGPAEGGKSSSATHHSHERVAYESARAGRGGEGEAPHEEGPLRRARQLASRHQGPAGWKRRAQPAPRATAHRQRAPATSRTDGLDLVEAVLLAEAVELGEEAVEHRHDLLGRLLRREVREAWQGWGKGGVGRSGQRGATAMMGEPRRGRGALEPRTNDVAEEDRHLRDWWWAAVGSWSLDGRGNQCHATMRALPACGGRKRGNWRRAPARTPRASPSAPPRAPPPRAAGRSG